MRGGACSRTALSEVVTPLILQKSLSVKMATFIVASVRLASVHESVRPPDDGPVSPARPPCKMQGPRTGGHLCGGPSRGPGDVTQRSSCSYGDATSGRYSPPSPTLGSTPV